MLQQFLYDNLRGSENLVDKLHEEIDELSALRRSNVPTNGWVSLTAWMTLDAHMSPHRSGYDAK
jgi:hypothetical protein